MASWRGHDEGSFPGGMAGPREGSTSGGDEYDVSGRQRTLMLAAVAASGLAERYAGDQALLDLHMRKLLKPACGHR